MSSCKFVVPAAALLLAGALAPTAAAASASCAEKSVSAAAIRSRTDVQAFVQCAYEYVREMGFEEAYRAFHEDARWKSGQFYVFVDELADSGEQSRGFVFPPDPSLEGQYWGDLTDGFDTDLIAEFQRALKISRRGWVYYKFRNPANGLTEPKASYGIRLDWEGSPAVLGAGIYRRDFPGTCHAAQVNASLVEAEQSMMRLEELVRCAALEIESNGYFAAVRMESDPRWRAGSIYLFGMDAMGNQLFSGRPDAASGERAAEWSRDPRAMFEGRDMGDVAGTFGESMIYYYASHPETGRWQPKAAFVKRVSAQGPPLLIGAGLYMDCPPDWCRGPQGGDGAGAAACQAARRMLADFPAGSIDYGYYNDFNPVSYASGQQPMGYEPDLVAAVETLSGGKLRFNRLAIGNPFSGIWLKSAQAAYDMVGGGITALPERMLDADGRQAIRFGVGHISFQQSLLARAESAIETHADLTSQHRVGALRGTTGEKRLLELTGITDAEGFLLAGTRVALADGSVVTAGAPSGGSGLRIAAGAGSASIAERVRLTPPGNKPAVIYYGSEDEQIQAVLDGEVDAVARGVLGNLIAARDPRLRVTAIDAAGNELGAFSYPNTRAGDALRVTMNTAVSCLTANGTIGFGEWLDSGGAVFAERARSWR